MFRINRVMPTTRADLPSAEVMEKWATLNDVIEVYPNGGADVKELVVEMGGLETDGVEILATADVDDMKESIAEWAEQAKPNTLRLSRRLLMLNAMRVAKDKEIVDLHPPPRAKDPKKDVRGEASQCV